jgi:hypothetical protein
LQELVARLRQEQKSHPKALQQLEKQKQALEKKLDGAARKEAALQRDNDSLQVRCSTYRTVLFCTALPHSVPHFTAECCSALHVITTHVQCCAVDCTAS